MSDNLDQIKARIKALSQKTVENGCTEEEAMAAMELVGKLLQKYNLSMTDADIREQGCKEDFLRINSKNINNNVTMLLSAVAMFCDCKAYTWRSHDERGSHVLYKFFGQETDVQMASYLLYVTTTAMLNEAHKYVKSLNVGQGGARSPSNSFQHAFALRIYRRLKEIKDKNNAQQTATQGTALIVLKDALVNEEWQKRHDELGLKQRPDPKRPTDARAFSAGTKAADNVNLNNPIEGRKAEANAIGRNKLLAN